MQTFSAPMAYIKIGGETAGLSEILPYRNKSIVWMFRG